MEMERCECQTESGRSKAGRQTAGKGTGVKARMEGIRMERIDGGSDDKVGLLNLD
jgi:hypothetical protein